MPNPKKPKVRVSVREAFMEESMKIVAGVTAELGIQFLPEEVVKALAAVVPERLLLDNDTRLRWAAVLGTALGLTGMKTSSRETISNFFVQGAEEVGKISGKLNEGNPEESRKAIRGTLEQKKQDLIAKLRGEKGQGNDKVQKQTLPDYFTAKAATEPRVQDILTEIEAALGTQDADRYDHFMRKGAYRIQTSPQELASIAEQSDLDEKHAYGVLRLISLMDGSRGEGGVKAHLKKIVENLLDELTKDEGKGHASKRLDRHLRHASKTLDAAIAKARRGI